MATERELQLLRAAAGAGITDRTELANFMAQVGHESGGLSRLEESFRYTRSAEQVASVVRSAMRNGRPALEAARLEALEGRPEALAELMYGGRMGNNHAGDGYRYRGRGYIQLTGRETYRAAGEALGIDLERDPQRAAEPETAARIAVWYWQTRVRAEDRDDVREAGAAINGRDPPNGLADRERRFEQWNRVLLDRGDELLPDVGQRRTAAIHVLSPDDPGQRPHSRQARSFDDVMRVMLPTQHGVNPHLTSDYGERRLNGRPDDHGGVDFNYVGGQKGINLRHPVVRSPVAGTVIYGDGQGAYGTVKIRDDAGNVHEILHLHSRSVRATSPPTRIEAGDPIGTMGGRGPRGAGQYPQHVHYHVRDPSGRTVDPEVFWHGRRIGVPTRTRSSDEHVGEVSKPLSNRHAAMADGLLRRGERGDDVLALQQSLNRLGARDAHGNPLVEDGRFGDRTYDAVEAYQRAHGLKVDGIAGPRTFESIRGRMTPREVPGQAMPPPQRPVHADHPAHPDHATYQRIHAWVQGTGRWNEEQARNVSAALYRAQASDPLVQRVDHVIGSRGRDGAENVFAVYAPYGDREPTFHVRVDGRIASQEPAAVALEHAERARMQQLDRSQQPVQSAAMRMA